MKFRDHTCCLPRQVLVGPGCRVSVAKLTLTVAPFSCKLTPDHRRRS
jgi:hypothetical protein